MSATKDRWEKWHPIARGIAQRMISREHPDLTDAELAEIRAELEGLHESKELHRAVHDMLFLAAALEHEGATEIAGRIFALVEAKATIHALDRVNHLMAVDRIEAVARSAKRFVDLSRDPVRRPAPDRDPKAPKAPKALRVRDLLKPIHA